MRVFPSHIAPEGWMSQTIFRTDLASILVQWQAGSLTNAQVHAWATDRFAASAWDAEDGAVNEVLGCLDMMDMNLVTEEDVAVLLAALDERTAEGAARQIEAHHGKVDFVARSRQLVDDPLYSRFCI
jgi:hypothetical protein